MGVVGADVACKHKTECGDGQETGGLGIRVSCFDHAELVAFEIDRVAVCQWGHDPGRGLNGARGIRFPGGFCSGSAPPAAPCA